MQSFWLVFRPPMRLFSSGYVGVLWNNIRQLFHRSNRHWDYIEDNFWSEDRRIYWPEQRRSTQSKRCGHTVDKFRRWSCHLILNTPKHPALHRWSEKGIKYSISLHQLTPRYCDRRPPVEEGREGANGDVSDAMVDWPASSIGKWN